MVEYLTFRALGRTGREGHERYEAKIDRPHIDVNMRKLLDNIEVCCVGMEPNIPPSNITPGYRLPLSLV